jgi:hypothetical protein
MYREVPRINPPTLLIPPSTAQPSQNFIPFVPILLVVHLVKGLSYTPRNLSLVKNLIPPGGIIRGTSLVLPCLLLPREFYLRVGIGIERYARPSHKIFYGMVPYSFRSTPCTYTHSPTPFKAQSKSHATHHQFGDNLQIIV